MLENNKTSIDIKDKCVLTVEEASAYSSIGVRRLQELLRDPSCKFVLRNGSKKLVKRKAFEEYLDKSYAI